MNLKFKIFMTLLMPAYNLQRLMVRIPRVKSIEETLEKIEKEQVSMSRYGDGEFDLIFGHSLAFQKHEPNLAERLAEVLKSNTDRHIVCIQDAFNGLSMYVSDTKAWWEYYVLRKRKKIKSIISEKKEYYNASVTRCYREIRKKQNTPRYFASFKNIFRDKDLLIIEGEKSRLGVGNDLFDGAKSIKRILCPAEDAYDKYGEILKAAKKHAENKLVLIALGPTATILAYDLHKAGFWALDLGHLDIEYEWFIRGITSGKNDESIRIEGKYVNEAKNGNIVEECNDERYLSEIVERIF